MRFCLRHGREQHGDRKASRTNSRFICFSDSEWDPHASDPTSTAIASLEASLASAAAETSGHTTIKMSTYVRSIGRNKDSYERREALHQGPQDYRVRCKC